MIESIEAKCKELYLLGWVDTKIAKDLGVSRSTIANFRKKYNLKPNFTYESFSKIDKGLFTELFNKGLSDSKIGALLNIPENSIYYYRKRHSICRESFREATEKSLTADNVEVLLGILMGDGSLSRDYKNARFITAHCKAHKAYIDYIADKLDNLQPKISYYKSKPHKSTGNCYEAFWCKTPCNPALNSMYEHFYRDTVKRIPIEIFDNFTWQSLAFMYMDDGSKHSSGGYCIATNCFSKEDLSKFQKFLQTKFGLQTTLWKSNVLYIKKGSTLTMKKNIEPYMCDCMKYKL